jgi:hypothetical protein
MRSRGPYRLRYGPCRWLIRWVGNGRHIYKVHELGERRLFDPLEREREREQFFPRRTQMLLGSTDRGTQPHSCLALITIETVPFRFATSQRGGAALRSVTQQISALRQEKLGFCPWSARFCFCPVWSPLLARLLVCFPSLQHWIQQRSRCRSAKYHHVQDRSGNLIHRTHLPSQAVNS